MKGVFMTEWTHRPLEFHVALQQIPKLLFTLESFYFVFLVFLGVVQLLQLFRSTSAIHRDFKYSMNWACPATCRPNLCLCRGAVHIRRKQREQSAKKRGDRNVESCWYLFISGLIYLLRFFFTCCVEVSNPTPHYSLSTSSSSSFSSSPICSAYLCANVYACFMALRKTKKSSH